MNSMQSLSNTNKVIVLGGTGLIGTELIKQLIELENVSEIITLGRRAPTINHQKLRKIEIDLERLDAHGEFFEGVVAVFCCLGTTMRQAKSREAFRRVDFDFPLLSAKISKARGVDHFLIVSAQGASLRSAFFYSRVKGELEAILKTISFRRLTIARPGLLLGRKMGERPVEDVASWFVRGLKPLWRGGLQKYAAVQASEVARGLIENLLGRDFKVAGLEIIEINN